MNEQYRYIYRTILKSGFRLRYINGELRWQFSEGLGYGLIEDYYDDFVIKYYNRELKK